MHEAALERGEWGQGAGTLAAMAGLQLDHRAWLTLSSRCDLVEAGDPETAGSFLRARLKIHSNGTILKSLNTLNLVVYTRRQRSASG